MCYQLMSTCLLLTAYLMLQARCAKDLLALQFFATTRILS